MRVINTPWRLTSVKGRAPLLRPPPTHSHTHTHTHPKPCSKIQSPVEWAKRESGPGGGAAHATRSRAARDKWVCSAGLCNHSGRDGDGEKKGKPVKWQIKVGGFGGGGKCSECDYRSAKLKAIKDKGLALIALRTGKKWSNWEDHTRQYFSSWKPFKMRKVHKSCPFIPMSDYFLFTSSRPPRLQWMRREEKVSPNKRRGFLCLVWICEAKNCITFFIPTLQNGFQLVPQDVLQSRSREDEENSST